MTSSKPTLHSSRLSPVHVLAIASEAETRAGGNSGNSTQLDSTSKGVEQIHTTGNEHLLEMLSPAEACDEIVQLIVYLLSTDLEDWTMALYICEHASTSQSVAEKSATTLRREFKYGTPRSQLLATKLWAIMLHNASDFFTIATTSQKFLDAIKDVLENKSTNQVVRDLHVGSDDTPFRHLWKRVKPPSAPDEGVPLDDDHLFNIKGTHSPPVIPAKKTVVICKARALYAYIGSHEDPYELSFAKDEILEILGNAGTWWHARKLDGTIGIAPSNFLQVLDGDQNSSKTQGNESSRVPVDYAKALYYYKASPHDPNEVSFAKDEILDVLDKDEKWWRVRKVDGTIGIAPSDYLGLLDDI
ncbi:Transmembrane osmosensor [Marasmius tenuissimus]|uniref:Class E vacuolar protein-sorting machinery protein HSE1 n=1 Tax=Marasmius tenuissimus TaxID=585030 RepID=A0ABR2ZMQ8_9AGAR